MPAVLAEMWTLSEDCRVGVNHNKSMVYTPCGVRGIGKHPLYEKSIVYWSTDTNAPPCGVVEIVYHGY